MDQGTVDAVEDLDVVNENEIIGAMTKLLDWNRLVRQESTNIKPSSILIGKIWTRLFFNLSSISEKHKALLGDDEDAHLGKYASHTNAAKIMRFNVLAFLHAVLVEEDAYHRVDENSLSSISVKFKQNPVTSVGQFTTKLGSMGTFDKLIKTHPIFSLIIKCPLIHPFLFPFGGINSADKTLLQQEKSLLDSFNKIIMENSLRMWISISWKPLIPLFQVWDVGTCMLQVLLLRHMIQKR